MPVAVPPALLLTPTITVHDAEKHGRDDGHDERHHEEVDDRVDLVLAVVRRHHDRLVLLRVVAGKDGPLEAVQVGEVFALDRGRVAAALDVDQQDRLLRPLDVGQVEQLRRRRVEREGKVQIVYERHVDVRALEHVRGAALPARAPRAVEQAGHVLAARRHAHRRPLDKVADQRRDGRIDVQRHQEEEGGAGRHRQEGKPGRRVEGGVLAQRPLGRRPIFRLLRRR